MYMCSFLPGFFLFLFIFLKMEAKVCIVSERPLKMSCELFDTNKYYF